MQEKYTSQSIEERMDMMLNKIIKHFRLDYISDIHIEFYRKKIVEYLDDENLESTDCELYHKLIAYINYK